MKIARLEYLFTLRTNVKQALKELPTYPSDSFAPRTRNASSVWDDLDLGREVRSAVIERLSALLIQIDDELAQFGVELD